MKLKEKLKDYSKICSAIRSVTHLDTRFIDQKGQSLFQIVHHSIPSALKTNEAEFQHLIETLKDHRASQFYYYINPLGLEYIAAGVWRSRQLIASILVGPFLSTIPTSEFTSDIISKNKLPVSERKQLHEFYQSLSVLSSHASNAIGDILVNLCSYPHIDSELFTTEHEIPAVIKEKPAIDREDNHADIELRYLFEKKLMDAIAKSDIAEIDRITKESTSMLNFSDRIPESPIRSAKNLSLVLNTVCRIAAERGGVHPVHLDHISERFAILIERAPNLPYLKNLGSVMTVEYGKLVNQFSTKEYTVIVRKAIDYIGFHLEESLTLKEIAKGIHVNASHLSRKFKQETGMTVTDYIHKKRVEEAKLYLERGNTSITEIAFMVGFNDVNYFSRVFKKFTSITPSQYAKKH